MTDTNDAGIGHNSGDVSSAEGVAKAELLQFIERIERVDEERAELASDRRDIFVELKSRGYDSKAITAILKIRKQDKSERQEQEAILELYMHALGMS